MATHHNPGSHRDIRARTTGHGVAVEGDGLGSSRPNGDSPALSGDDIRYFSQKKNCPPVRVKKGAELVDGMPIYSSDLKSGVMGTNPILDLWNAVDAAFDRQLAAEKVVAEAQRDVDAARLDVEAAVASMRLGLQDLDRTDPAKSEKVRAAMRGD